MLRIPIIIIKINSNYCFKIHIIFLIITRLHVNYKRLYQFSDSGINIASWHGGTVFNYRRGICEFNYLPKSLIALIYRKSAKALL